MKLNPKHKIALWKRLLLPMCSALVLSSSFIPQAFATDLPSGVLNYLRHKDPQVKVRFDGVVVFSNGETYVPVLPQDPALNPDSQLVVATIPEKAAYPDLIQFDNNFFLMRLIQTASGRLTFPKMAEYPIQLKEGLLPQDFVLPDNLFIPVELKVILGSLPYNPSNKAPETVYSSGHSGVLSNSPLPANGYQLKSAMRLTYVFDLTEQKLIGIDTITGRKQGDVPLDCIPSSLRLSEDGKLLFAPCLSTNELVVVDTGSNLVKTRVSVGQRPDAVLYLDNTQDVLVSNRFSPFLSLLNSETLIGGQKIDLPGNGGAMAAVQVSDGKGYQVLVADAFKAQVYLVDMTTHAVVKTVQALPDITAMRAYRDSDGHIQLWVASRTKGQLAMIDVDHDKILKTLDVGAKPVDMAEYGDDLYVVSAGASQVDVVDRHKQSIVSTIPLEADSFPSGIITMAEEKRAYVVTAATNSLIVINLIDNQVENTFPVEFRANMIATVPDKRESAPEPIFVATPSNSTSTANQSSKDTQEKQDKADKPKVKRHGLFGKREPEPQAKNKKSSKSSGMPSGGKSSAVQTQTQQALKLQAPKNGQPSGITQTNHVLANPVAIPVQPGSASSSPLYGESQGKIRLFLGGNQKKQNKPSSPEANSAQAAKAGARLSDPVAPEPQSDNRKMPADPPNAMLMMAPDVQK